MTTSRKSLLFLAASAVVLSLFASGPASADAPVAVGTKSVKRKCVNSGTAKVDALAYKVSVKAKFCLVYTMVSKSVRGKTVSQPEVSSVEEETTVSHSGYLPERDGRAATDLLSDIEKALQVRSEIDVIRPFKRDDGQGQGFLFYPDSWWGWDPIFGQYGRDLMGELLESGFSCSKGKCRPLKRSVVLRSSAAISIPQGEQGRVFMRVSVSDSINPPKESTLYWDNGDPCGVAFPQCASLIKPVTSFKSESGRGFFEDWDKNGTLLGIPASLRARDRCDCPVG